MIINDDGVVQRPSALPKERRSSSSARRDYVTLSIPRELYEKAEGAIKGTGFRSVTEYAIFVLRESLLLKAGESVRDRLKALGYID
jgi:intein/homing endonuclease